MTIRSVLTNFCDHLHNKQTEIKHYQQRYDEERLLYKQRYDEELYKMRAKPMSKPMRVFLIGVCIVCLIAWFRWRGYI